MHLFGPHRGNYCATRVRTVLPITCWHVLRSGVWYEAEITNISGVNFGVTYTQFGNSEVVPATSIRALPGKSGSGSGGTSFAYSLFVHSFHACRDRVVLSTVQFVWRGHAKTPTTRAGPWPDFALRLE